MPTDNLKDIKIKHYFRLIFLNYHTYRQKQFLIITNEKFYFI